MTDSWVTSCEIPLSWISLNLTDKSTLVQVMAWCRQATSHYLNQCWPRSMSPYGITRPQWVNVMRKERLRQRKGDKKAAARYCSMSSEDSVSMLRDSAEEEGLDSSECESSSSTFKSVVNVTKPSPAPWDMDVDSPPRKRSGGNSSGCSYHGLSYVAYDVINFAATAMSSVSGLCSRHTPDAGYTHRESQIPRLLPRDFQHQHQYKYSRWTTH